MAKCPKCGEKFNPASLMAKQRAASLTRQRRHNIAVSGGLARAEKARQAKAIIDQKCG